MAVNLQKSPIFFSGKRSAVPGQRLGRAGALAYDFDDVKPDSAVVTMRWDKVAVPFKVQVNVNEIVTASVVLRFAGSIGITGGWDDAAGYFLANKIDLDEALKDEDQSIQAEERYDNLLNKSKILEVMGRSTRDAEMFRTKALDKASFGANPCIPILGKPTVATVPPRFTVRLAAMGSGANRPSAFNKARSLAAST